MEVATTATANNHNHSHHHGTHFHHPEQQRMPSHHPHNSLNVGLISNGTGSGSARSPFQREVREWQRIDPDTGALLTGRLEADRWINGPMNSYGKISDSQNISQPNGTQHTQRKQLEVLQARTATGAMQVIRAQTVQTTSSRWSSSTSASTSASSSAVPSPTIMGALTTDGNSSLSNHLKLSHSANPHSRLGLLIPTASALPQMSTLEICEVSNSHSGSSRGSSDADVDVDADDYDVDADDNFTGNMINAGDVVNSSKHFLNRHSFLNNSHNNIGSSNLSLLLDTAPSLKLSNLMKSNSSLSSNNSSSNNSTISNTHQQKSAAGKISLHAIVGGVENTRRTTTATASTSSSSSSLTQASAASWQQQHQHQQRSSRLFEQPTLYGNGSQCQSLTKSRVGVNAVKAGTGGDAVAAAVAVVYDGGDGDSTTPTQLKSIQQQNDLESFRHYNEHQSTSTSTSTSAALMSASVVNTGNDDDDDDELRFTKQSQQRQKPSNIDTTTSLQRSRSISTDDLSTEWEKHSDNDNEEPGDWRRVSKLRRSFQSSSNSKTENPSQLRRPIDLPSNSVSVARIRAELENGRRLNTAMRNNHVDLAALDTILNGTVESTKPQSTQRSSFLTAESLKEIRAGLKKLSDESLYRDDYVPAAHSSAPDEHIEIQDVKKPPERIRLRQLTPEKATEITPPKSAFQVFTRPIPTISSPTNSYMTQRSLPNGNSPKHTTHSLESRQKTRESASSIDWHLRRKSYGFEKMSPPDDKSMFRMDASTDSGLGRSGDQLGNWSPTESGGLNPRTTVIHFGETSKVVANTSKPTVHKNYRELKSPESIEADPEQKRHSIAVDESQYMRDSARKKSQVHLNGYYNALNETAKNSVQPTEATSSASALFQRNTTQQKRVEFCKTEVHFAAESGRVNIVETDGKPPPTNNFRRRRRTTSGPLQTLIKSVSSTVTDSTTGNSLTRPITHFGDTLETSTLTSTTVAYKASVVETLPDNESATTNVTFTTPKVVGGTFTHSSSSRSSYASTSGVDTTDGETDEISGIRGILKNKPIKPKPYHLGENIESTDALWGVQLKPITGTGAIKNEFLKSASPPSMASTSVAERVRIVEQRQDNASLSQTAANNYSTKINLSLGDEPKVWSDTGTTFITDNTYNLNQRRPSLQEIMLQDLREHQRILDEGLKSTSLIIKTMRSANEFDEAMRRLSIASVGAAIIPPIVIPTPMLRSHSYQESTRRSSITSLKSNDNVVIKSASTASSSSITLRRSSTDAACSTLVAQPVANPRLKLLGNTEIPVSQQLTQLRRMYELAAANSASQDEDSADEEVKRYFNGYQQNESSDSGGGTQESSSLEDERFTEYSSSWSRLKAKRTVWRIGSHESNRQIKTLERAELPKSNVMSIELHSPQTSLERQDATKLIETTRPIAKPRTIMSAQSPKEPREYPRTSVKQATENSMNSESNHDYLKIVKETRGARKLREHELSFFGVQAPKDAEIDINSTYPSKQLTTQKRSLPQRKTNDDYHKPSPLTESISETTKQQMTTKWRLLNDKPDLLRHSPITVEPQITTRTAEVRPMERKSLKKPDDNDAENDEHVYENIATEIKPVFKVKSPSRMVEKGYDEQSYNRKLDLKRDAMILNEMTESADQTLKALSDEAAIKDQRRRSLHRRSSKPLETIDERTIAEKINDKCIAVQVTRSTLASEAKRSSRHISPSPTKATSRARSSSLSSNEGRPRARSRSLSSEREYENIKERPKRISTSATRSRTTKLGSRSSAHETQHTAHTHCCSSGDDEANRRTERLRSSASKSKPSSSSETRKHSSRNAVRQRDIMHYSPAALEKSQRRDNEHKKRTSSSTAHSSRRERVECNDEVKTHSSSHHHSKPHERAQHHPTESPSSRRHKEHKSTGSSRKTSDEKRHHHDTSHQDTERSSRSKGQSSRSGQHKSERSNGTNHEKHSTSVSKSREHRKPTTTSKQHSSTDTKHREPAMSTTHSKNASLINGQHQHAHHQNGNHDNHHVHSMTTATIAAKQRESRSGKDRK